MASNPYSPPGESPSDLWHERSNFVGAVLGNVAYGIHVAVFAECAYRIRPWSRPTRQSNTTRSWLMLAYISTLFLMNTIDVACNTRMLQHMFIDDRNFPGGPSAWYSANFDSPVSIAGNASFIIANFLADGLLLWRTYVVWDSVWVVSFPFLVYSTTMSILSVFQTSRPSASLWTAAGVQFSLPYFSISIPLNVMLTILLVSRLLYMSWELKRTFCADHAKVYISIAAMILESGAPYAVVGLIFIITYARNSDVQDLALPVLSQVMCISPELIILRVATGRAVNSIPRTKSTTLEFAHTHHEPTSVSDMASGALGSGTGSGSSVTMELHPESIKREPDGQGTRCEACASVLAQ